MSLLLPTRDSPLVCYVTDRLQLPAAFGEQARALTAKTRAASAAGVDLIQIREKDLAGAQLAELAREVIAGAVCHILLNDRLDVACAVGAAGVHLGEKSVSVRDAKSFARTCCRSKSFWIGASVHSLEAAKVREGEGADYLIFGPVFSTPAKALLGPPQGLGRLKEICHQISIPVLAIGGVTAENANDCYAQGAAGIAGIRLFQEARNLERLVEQLHAKQ